MHNGLVFLGKLLLWLVLWAVCLPVFNQAGFGPEQCARDYVLVKFRPETCQDTLQLAREDALRWLVVQLPLPPGTVLREPSINHWLRSKSGRTKAQSSEMGLMLDRFLYLDLPPGVSVADCIARLRQFPLVEYVERDGVGSLCLLPRDVGFGQQWQHYQPASSGTPAKSGPLNTPEAWDITTGSSNVTVAIIDSGINWQYPDFEGRLVRGFNVVSNNYDTQDRGHGNIIASVLGSNANNFNEYGFAYGFAGVDWQCRMMAIKVVDSDYKTRESWAAQGIDFAVTNGCQVILFSAELTNAESSTLWLSVSNAMAKGVIVVCPSGNLGHPIDVYPAKFAATIAVGAVALSPSYPRADFSNYGPELNVVAPGQYVDGTLTGTSYASALVAGICSLMLSVHPGLTHGQVRTLVALGARDLGAPGFDIYYGWGLANAYNSVILARTRIEKAERSSGNIWHMVWASPPNAYSTEPYQVEFTRSLSEPWQVLTNGTFTYENAKVYYNGAYRHDTNRTYWVGEVPSTVGQSKETYFRLGIRLKE